VAERSPRQTPDHRNTKSQRGRMRAASVLANTKPETHQDASSKGSWPGEKEHFLTQGDIFGESQREVSRGRSSEESRRKSEGAKDRRNNCKATSGSVDRAGGAQTSVVGGGGPTNHGTNPNCPGDAVPCKRRGERNCGTHANRRE